MIAKEDLFLTSDKSEIVSADDSRASFLLVRKGKPIPADALKKYSDVNTDPDDDGVAEGGVNGVKKAFSAPPKTSRQKGKK